MAEQTLATHLALVHGDVSPKNILMGKENPIFLDAETAWFGDPAFDLAFCLNHFLLKSVFRSMSVKDYLACFESFTNNYLGEVNWEPSENIETRAANLLPILLLARVDGKSPVEYLTNESAKNQIRKIASEIFLHQPKKLSEIVNRWIYFSSEFE